jgi:hemolysin activation/secretion protein
LLAILLSYAWCSDAARAAEPTERGKAAPGATALAPRPVPIALPATSDKVAAGGPKVQVRLLAIKGNTVFDSAMLLAQTGFVANGTYDLAQLQQMAQKVQDYYQSQGYFLTRAYLPQQHNDEGRVMIEVLEARYGKVDLQNPANLAARRVAYLTEGLKSAEMPKLPQLERALLLLNEVPGLAVKSIIVPGKENGQADLLLTVEPSRKWIASVDFDRNGSKSTGAERLGASLGINNPFNQGDQFNLRLLSSFQGLNNGRIAYQTPIGPLQTTLAYTVTDYSLGREFASLRANGTSRDWSLAVATPLIHTRQKSLNLQVGVADKKLVDRVDSIQSRTEKATTLWNLGLSGERYDEQAGRGVSSFSLNWASGDLRLRSPILRAQDDVTLRSAGRFSKVSYNLNRQHCFNQQTTLSLNFSGQRASKNLDSSEKLVLGGASGVRAYPQDEASGDQGNVLNLELRHALPTFAAAPGVWQVVGFVDAGESESNRDFAGSIHRTLYGAGFGLRWDRPTDFSIRLDFAWKLGNERALADTDRNGRVWLQGVKYF